MKLVNEPSQQEAQEIAERSCEDSEDDTYVSVFSNLVTVDVDEYARKHFCRSVKKTVTIPQWLDDMATRNHVSFSKVMQEVLADKLGVSLAI